MGRSSCIIILFLLGLHPEFPLEIHRNIFTSNNSFDHSNKMVDKSADEAGKNLFR